MIFKHFQTWIVSKKEGVIHKRFRRPRGQARPPAKPARHSPEAQLMADGQAEAEWEFE
jgi:hypothetical protein